MGESFQCTMVKVVVQVLFITCRLCKSCLNSSTVVTHNMCCPFCFLSVLFLCELYFLVLMLALLLGNDATSMEKTTATDKALFSSKTAGIFLISQ